MNDLPGYTFIKTDKKLVKLHLEDILFIKGLGNYVELHVRNKRKYVYYKTLKDLIDKLPNGFMRIHNSYIINLRNVDHIEDNHLVIEDHRISVAKSYRECLGRSIDKLLL